MDYIDVITGEIRGPKWMNECGHPAESYIGSFEYRGEAYDVYVFDQRDDQHVCIRYGNEPEKYYSPGRIQDFLRNSTHLEIYQRAYKIISKHGGFIYRRNLKE